MREDISSIERLLGGYCHAVDRGTLDEIMGIFHARAVLRPVYQGPETHEGMDAVRAWYERYLQETRAPLKLLRHRISTLSVRPVPGAQDEVRAVCYMDVDAVTRGGRLYKTMGRYDDRLQYTDDRWWIVDRSIHVDHTAEIGTPRP